MSAAMGAAATVHVSPALRDRSGGSLDRRPLPVSLPSPPFTGTHRLRRAPIAPTAIMYRFFAPVLSAQFLRNEEDGGASAGREGGESVADRARSLCCVTPPAHAAYRRTEPRRRANP